jgi:CDP-diacylglycerol--glycerol-3-phosphate 3-phosphatidyltransferase
MHSLCGLSDIIDRAIARKTNAVSSFASKLDTVADAVFMAVCAVKLLPMIYHPIWVWMWIAVIAIIKFANIVMRFVRKKQLFIEPTYSFAVVCSMATVAAIEEGYHIVKANGK